MRADRVPVIETRLIDFGVCQVQTLLRGPEGSQVRLSILRSDPEGLLEKMDLVVERNEELGRMWRSKAREEETKKAKEEETMKEKRAAEQVKEAAASSPRGLSFFGLPVTAINSESRRYIESFSEPKAARQAEVKVQERALIDAVGAAREALDPSELASSLARVSRAEAALSQALHANRSLTQVLKRGSTHRHLDTQRLPKAR